MTVIWFNHAIQALTPSELASALGRLKPTFTHHHEARRLASSIYKYI